MSLKTRIITSIFIIAAMIAVLILSKTVVYPITLAILATIAVFEVLRVHQLHKNLWIAAPAYIITAAMPVMAYVMRVIMAYSEIYFIVALALVLFVFMIYVFGVAVFLKGKVSFASISSAFAMLMYITSSFSALCIIRYIIDDTIGLFCLGLVLIGAWISDVFAYFTGMLIGKHKLIPEVSPKKTVEGSLGGIVFTVIACLLFGFIASLVTGVKANYLVLGISGVVLSVVGQIGDLFASLVKREHGIKDYGSLLPGHGGIMDRFDSILATSAATMVIALLFTPFSW